MKQKAPLSKDAAKPGSAKKKPTAKSDANSAKHAGGRPTLYDDSMPERAREYFKRAPFTMGKKVVTRKDGSVEETDIMIPVELPTLAGLAVELGVHRDTLNEWTRQHQVFSDAIKVGKAHQERILIANGLTGMYEGAFAIFTAKNLMGWRDKLAIGGDEDNPAPVAQASNATDYAALREKMAGYAGSATG